MMHAHLTSLTDHSPLMAISYQGPMLDYWHQLCGTSHLPLKRQFRPQLFPTHLSDLVVIEVKGHDMVFDITLMGTRVHENLYLRRGELPPHPIYGQVTSNTVEGNLREIFTQVRKTSKPLFASGVAGGRSPTYFGGQPFTTLVMPFAKNADIREPDVLIAAFDFVESPSVEADVYAFH